MENQQSKTSGQPHDRLELPRVEPRRHSLLQSSILTDPTQCFYDVYKPGRELGRGNFGVVRECVDRSTGGLFACKTICKETLSDDGELQEVRREISVLQKLSRKHENVVALQGVFEDQTSIHIVMELCQEGELYHHIQRSPDGYLEEAAALPLFKQLAEAVSFCHENGVVHRDVKPENILLAAGMERAGLVIKLADFGLAISLLKGQRITGMAGSKFYQAPEILCGQSYSFKADVWSLGIVLYALLSGRLPFLNNDRKVLLRLIKRCKIDFDERPWPSVSDGAKKLIRKMLVVDPRSRISSADVLKDPWLALQLPARQPAAEVLATRLLRRDGLWSDLSLSNWQDELQAMPTAGRSDSAHNSHAHMLTKPNGSQGGNYPISIPFPALATPPMSSSGYSAVHKRHRVDRSPGESPNPRQSKIMARRSLTSNRMEAAGLLSALPTTSPKMLFGASEPHPPKQKGFSFCCCFRPAVDNDFGSEDDQHPLPTQDLQSRQEAQKRSAESASSQKGRGDASPHPRRSSAKVSPVANFPDDII